MVDTQYTNYIHTFNSLDKHEVGEANSQYQSVQYARRQSRPSRHYITGDNAHATRLFDLFPKDYQTTCINKRIFQCHSTKSSAFQCFSVYRWL